MRNNENLLSGDIKKALISLSLPLMGISFIQITYNLVDMFWLGRFSSEAVAAVGTASLLNYIGNSLALVGRVGSATWISQNYGKGKYIEASKYVESGLKVNLFISFIFTLISFIFMKEFLNMFTLTETLEKYAIEYLSIQIPSMFIVFLNPMFAVAYNSVGNSVTPFKLSLIGLILNFILDPLFLYVFNFGVKGVALATAGAQGVVLIGYILISRDPSKVMSQVRYFSKADYGKIKNIISVGWPASVQSTAMAFISVILNTFISNFGPMPMAVYSLGIQIESICWMTADGIATAIGAFMGQNLGAENYERLKNGYKESIKILIGVGLVSMIILIGFGESLVAVFMPDDIGAIKEGGRLLRIMGICEIMMALEIGINGALSGLGLTKFPAFNGLFGNLLRIPISLLLMPLAGVVGIWVSISTTMALKGFASLIAYNYINRNTNGFRKLAYRRE